jgi:bacterioferritin-associated ferredoxin
MIVCSCNVLSKAQVLATLQLEGAARPRSPGQAYRRLGCAPRCGRCVATIRALLVDVHRDGCKLGCSEHPASDAHHVGKRDKPETSFLIAAA